MPTDTNEAPGQSGLARAATMVFWRDLMTILAFTVAVLVLGAKFLVPLTFAMLIFVLLTSVIDHIAQWHVGGWQVPRWLAHVLGFALVLLGIGLVVEILASQSDQIAETLPIYYERLQRLLDRLASFLGEENAVALREAIGGGGMPRWALGAMDTAGGFLGALFLVILYVPFMMAERPAMHRKIAIAAPDPKTGRELRNMAASISAGLRRYVGIKTFVSALTGLFSYAVMKPIGLDFAESWALLAFALNFIPSIGSILGVVFPALIALIQFDTLTPFMIIVLGCGSVQFSIGNILEPALTGRSLNISTLLVILSLTFWTAVWGVAGAFLSVPITVCLLIIVSNVPPLRWLAVLMSGDGELITGLRDDPTGAPGQYPHASGPKGE